MLQIFLKKEGQKGFTLIELMIVMAIIGVLVAIAIPQFMMYKKKGYVASINSDCKNAYTAAIAYNVDHAGIIATTSDLTVGGYAQTGGVTTAVTAWSSDTTFTIACTGDPSWGLSSPTATYTVVNGDLTVNLAMK